MKKKILAVLLSACMLTTAVPTAVFAADAARTEDAGTEIAAETEPEGNPAGSQAEEDSKNEAGNKQDVFEDSEENGEEESEEQRESAAAQAQFSDVTNRSSSYYAPVYWAADKGITTGYSDGTFGVSRNCSRGAFVTFLWRQKGSPEPTLTAEKSGLKDFDSIGASYQKAVLWAVEKGITTGYRDHTFHVGANVTRGAAVTFLWRAAGKPKVSITRKDVAFKDMVPAGSSYEKGILWAVENKITTGYRNHTFRPASYCTRGATVTFLQRSDRSIVYWTKNGTVYHQTRNCPSLKNSKKILDGTVAESGKTRACKDCYH